MSTFLFTSMFHDLPTWHVCPIHNVGHIIGSRSLNFWDIKISTAPLNSPRKTALKKNKIEKSNFSENPRWPPFGHFWSARTQNQHICSMGRSKGPCTLSSHLVKAFSANYSTKGPNTHPIRNFGDRIGSSSLNFWDIKILTAPLDTPQKTALEQLKI